MSLPNSSFGIPLEEEMKLRDRLYQEGVCPRCKQPLESPDGHGECFDWMAIQQYEGIRALSKAANEAGLEQERARALAICQWRWREAQAMMKKHQFDQTNHQVYMTVSRELEIVMAQIAQGTKVEDLPPTIR